MSNTFSKAFYSAIYVYVEFFIGLIASILIARSLGPEDFGVYSYLLRVAAILLIFINGGVAVGLIRFSAEKIQNAAQEKELVTTIFHFFRAIQRKKLVIVLGVFILLLHFIFDVIQPEQNDWMVLLLCLGVAFKSYYMFQVGLFKGLERFDVLARIVACVSPLYLALVCIGMYMSQGLLFFIATYVVVSLLFTLLAGYYVKEYLVETDESLSGEFKSRAANFVKVTAANTVLATLVIGYVEVFFLEYYSTSDQVGFFNIGLTLSGAAMGLVPGVYNNFLMPRIVKHVGHLSSHDLRTSVFVFTTIRHMLILALLVAIPLAYYSEYVIRLLYGEEFIAAGFALAWVSIGYVSMAISQPIMGYLGSQDKQAWLLKVNLVIISLSLVSSYFLISSFGLHGAVYSFLLMSALNSIALTVLLILFTRKIAGLMQITSVLVSAALGLLCLKSIFAQDLGFWVVPLGSIVYVLVFMCLVWILNGFTREEKAQLKALLSRQHVIK